MEPELFFPDPFVKGGWFVFYQPDYLLFRWRTLYATYNGMDPASMHSTKLKALRWIEKEIQTRLAKEGKIVEETEIYPGKLIIPETQRTLIRLTYDWEPLNRALEKSK